MTGVTVRLPGAVWSDTLDPACSTMQSELGLPEPEIHRRGRGYQVIYRDVRPAVAENLRLHLLDMAQCRWQPDDVYGQQMSRKLVEAASRMVREPNRGEPR